MRIDNVYGAYRLYDTKGTGRSRRVNNQGTQNRDIFSLSEQAEDYQIARRAVSRIPEVRQEKVDTLQNQISSGQYSVSAAMIADKILQNAVHTVNLE